jgi:hypothetical protein
MSARIQWDGLNDLIRDLTNAPRDIRDEGLTIIREETEGAANEISQQYARKTGTLAARVTTEYPSSTILIGIVKSRAPHSHLYEFGTKKRETNAGANRGTMPEKEVTVPIARRRRSRMYRRLGDMLRAKGFEVTGE